MRGAMIVPAPLAPGSTVRIIAPASPFDLRLMWRGMGWLAERYRVRFSRRIFERCGYLAGSDDSRLAELRRALEEADVGAVFCARGGYGISRIAHRIDWNVLRRSPRWLVGFSDVTALHVEASASGVASLHASNVTGLGRGDALMRAAMVRALEHPDEARVFDDLEVVTAGDAHGQLQGGNLTLLHACAVAGRLRIADGCVLLIEDVGERPYRIDRMLTTLQVGGYLARPSAFVVGELDDCRAGADGVTTRDVIAERLGRLGVPVVTGAPVGHGLRNQPVVLGLTARVAANAAGGVVKFGAKSVTKRCHVAS